MPARLLLEAVRRSPGVTDDLPPLIHASRAHRVRSELGSVRIGHRVPPSPKTILRSGEL